MYFLLILPASMIVPRRWRLRLPVLWLSKCFLPACRRLSLPEAVTRNLFFDPLWVFIFGMVVSPKTRRPLACTKGPAHRSSPGPLIGEGIIGESSRRVSVVYVSRNVNNHAPFGASIAV